MTMDPTQDPVGALIRMLDLADGGGARTTEDIFVGRTITTPRARVYGGQVLAQASMAAMRTVDPDRAIHSLHAYFLRGGDIELPITFGVERVRDGRSFSARRIHAYQEGKTILSMIASFQEPAQGLEHQDEMPQDVPDPESLPSLRETFGALNIPEARAQAFERPFDMRYITEPLFLPWQGPHDSYNAVWVKALAPLPDDPAIHRAALAYVSDYTMMEPILRRHGRSWGERGMNVASLDHAMWWHRYARADEWILYTQTSPNASSARGLAIGKMFTRDGTMIATTVQEGMMRLPEFH
ncbi:acyl-CoA thioesterase II [Kocuria marina subsp. indica]|uniref:acyl-CoA thioesterase n=1 Tax=Kocuria TaxID=57493 RepID=UPI00103FB6E1|nr:MULTISPECIES: acyl-CoA thioesterase II [Kocuria]MDT0119805.1 acyl-CoA thioesterase II [Kocuria sp. PD6]QBJ21359.1 acyl-CoA thioesterase II [Kocuria indica]